MGGPSDKHTGPGDTAEHKQVRLSPWKPDPDTGDWMRRAVHRADRLDRLALRQKVERTIARREKERRSA